MQCEIAVDILNITDICEQMIVTLLSLLCHDVSVYCNRFYGLLTIAMHLAIFSRYNFVWVNNYLVNSYKNFKLNPWAASHKDIDDL